MRRPAVRLLALCCLVFALAGCSPGGDLPPLPRAPAGDYQLGPGDTVRLITFGETQLTGDFRVGASGRIALPLLGDVRAAGRTPAQLQTAVALALKRRNLLRDPSVSVEVSEYRPIFVLGEVNKPGQYSYQPDMTVVTAVAVAGGFTYRAVHDTVSVVRTIDGNIIEGRARRETRLLPGDVITVFERRF